MSRLAEMLFAFALTLWVGALWVIGYIAAPVLFSQLESVQLAGSVAGRLFEVVAWLGIACATYLIAYLIFRQGLLVFRSGVFWMIVSMLLLTCAGHFGVRPILDQLRLDLARELVTQVVKSRFSAWHGIASVLWMIQSGFGFALITQVIRK